VGHIGVTSEWRDWLGATHGKGEQLDMMVCEKEARLGTIRDMIHEMGVGQDVIHGKGVGLDTIYERGVKLDMRHEMGLDSTSHEKGAWLDKTREQAQLDTNHERESRLGTISEKWVWRGETHDQGDWAGMASGQEVRVDHAQRVQVSIADGIDYIV
jgi:hypothetical protein